MMNSKALLSRFPLPALPASLSVLRNREFRIFWSGQAVSLTGTWAQGMAQSWLVLGLTSSAFALGLVNFALAIPTVLLALLGGAAADRMDKRRLLLVTQVAMMLLAVVLGTLVAFGQPQFWHVLLVALLLGVATAYDLPANQALVPELVEPQDISKAIALNGSVFHGSRLVGPGLAGLVIGMVGLAGGFFLNAVSFLAVIASLLAIRSRGVAPGARRQSQARAVLEGLVYVRSQPRIAAMLGFTALTAAFVFPNLAVMLPVYARDVLGVDVGAMGIMMATSGLGAPVGSMALLNVRREQQMRRIGLGVVLLVLALSALAWVRVLPLALLGILVLGFGVSSAMGLAATVIQQQVDASMRGRVMGIYSLAFMGVIPFSGLAATALTDATGLPTVMQLSAVLYAFGALGLFASMRSRARGFGAEPTVQASTAQ
jgi:MFS family permease